MFEKVKDILIEELSINPNDIKPESELVNDFGLNSLELADLVLMCEEKFGVEIGDEAIHSFITVGDISEYLEKNAK